MTARLAAGLEVSALIRQVNAAGGFATVIAKGEAEAGTILVVSAENGLNTRLYERMPDPDGHRHWHCARRYDPAEPQAFADYLARRQAQDGDVWIVELDIANAERFIELAPGQD